MSRLVSVYVECVVADRDVLEEAKKLLEKYGVREIGNRLSVGPVKVIVLDGGRVEIVYDEDNPRAKDVAAKTMDALIAASVARSVRSMGASVRVHETEQGFEIEGWT